MKRKLVLFMALSFIFSFFFGCLSVYAEDYKYIPPEAPDNWSEMTSTERRNYIVDLLGGSKSDKYKSWSQEVYNQYPLLILNSLNKKDDLVIINSPNVGDNKNFLLHYKEQKELYPTQNAKMWQYLSPYIIFYDYDLMYSVCEGKTLELSDFYENFPILNPAYVPSGELKSIDELLATLDETTPDPEPEADPDPDPGESVSSPDINLEPLSETNPIPVVAVVAAGTILGFGVFAFFFKGH